jgi:hypothetical protein
MQPSHQLPQQFSDFTTEYIAALAQQNAFTYVQEDAGDGVESSLYNNPKTNTTEYYKLKLTIAGLQCEYYTADFTPLIYQDMPAAFTVADLSTNIPAPIRMQVQVFSIDLAYAVENLYVESRTNITINNILGIKSVAFKNVENIQLEGDFSYFFRAYVPKNEAVNAFTILAPNIMLSLLADGGDYDFEFSGSKIYFYKTFSYSGGPTIPLTKSDYDRMLTFGIKSATLLARASRPAKITDTAGVPEMWQLYGMSQARIGSTIGIIIVSFMFIATCLLNPLLWPIGGIVAIVYFAKRRRLQKKRQKLVTDWQH